MKTKQVVLVCILGLSFQFTMAQVSEPVNAIASPSSYLGTSNAYDVIFKSQGNPAGLLSTTKTSFGVNSLAMPNSVSIGIGAGRFSSGSGFNTYIGQDAGKGLNSTYTNSGTHNSFLGVESGIGNTTGNQNVFFGALTAAGNTTGSNNTYVGFFSGSMDDNGNNNTYIGSQAGGESSYGSGNVYIGSYVGFGTTNNNVLMIDNFENSNPLIWGNFANNELKLNAKVGIGNGFGNYPTTAGSVDVSAYNLFVTGGILTEEVRVSSSGEWADYVFNKEYNLKSLNEVEQFINDNGHLPNMPSAQKVKEEGIELGEMAKKQQEKIEELTLYLLQQNKEIEELKAQMRILLEKK